MAYDAKTDVRLSLFFSSVTGFLPTHLGVNRIYFLLSEQTFQSFFQNTL